MITSKSVLMAEVEKAKKKRLKKVKDKEIIRKDDTEGTEDKEG